MSTPTSNRHINTKRVNQRTKKVFEDLEAYLGFCKSFGYKFDESDLYSNRSYIWRQYGKHLAGKPVKDMWELYLNPSSAPVAKSYRNDR